MDEVRADSSWTSALRPQEHGWRTWEAPSAIALLAVATALLFHSLIQAGWVYDDPVHVYFAAMHTPAEYFLGSRDVMLRQSYAHVTPWNALFYDMMLPWGGLDARWHHAHLLVIVWVTACATWALLRRWLVPVSAAVGALLFLCMAPTASGAYALTTAHYVYGLLFSILAVHAWLSGLRARAAWQAWSWAMAAAAFYALACLCKELYAPLPLVLLCMPSAQTSWARRWRLLLPVCAVAAAYVLVRIWLFGLSIGGYTVMDGDQAPPAIPALLRFAGLARTMLFGPGLPGAWAIALVVAIVLLGIVARRIPSLGGLAACSTALLLPLLPAAARVHFGFGDHRVLIPSAWALAVLLACMLPVRGWQRYAALLLCLPLGGVLVLGHSAVFSHYEAQTRVQAVQNDFMAKADSDQILLPAQFDRVGYLEAMASAAAVRSQRSPAGVLATEEALEALGPQQGRLVIAWNEACACLQPLGEERYWELVSLWQKRLHAGAGRDWQVQLRLRALNDVRRQLGWRVDLADGLPPAARIWLDVDRVGRIELGPSGEFSFGVDGTTPLWDEHAHLRILVEAADGALLRSPGFSLPMRGAHQANWRAGEGTPAVQPLPAIGR